MFVQLFKSRKRISINTHCIQAFSRQTGGNPLLWRYLNKIDVARIYNCLIQNNIDTINPWRYFLSFFETRQIGHH
ncbi:Uncharacterised protein [Shigella sonnei]|nr:Uncharacterised protein [Shigella sonnei]